MFTREISDSTSGNRKRLWIAGSVLAVLGCLLTGTWLVSRFQSAEEGPAADPAVMARLEAELSKVRPNGLFIVIDTAANRLYLRKGADTLLEAVCSTGSGIQLVAGERQWTFRTPRGVFKVRSKAKDPIWRKPDWAFLEEGEAVPKRESDRFEEGVLGEYAIGIGDGYFIHGTLYTRLLGTNVTHGCVRLGSEDLEFLARKVPTGTRVYIF